MEEGSLGAGLPRLLHSFVGWVWNQNSPKTPEKRRGPCGRTRPV